MENGKPFMTWKEDGKLVSPRRHNQLVYSGMVEEKLRRLRPVMYVIDDPTAGEIQIFHTANAWWLDKSKVQRLIDGLKSGNTIRNSCSYARINEIQWKHFNKIHPHFEEVKKILASAQVLRAMNRLNSDDSLEAAKFVLKHKDDQFKTRPTMHDLDPNRGDILPEDYDHEDLVESFDQAAEDYREELFRARPRLRVAYEKYSEEQETGIITNSGIMNSRGVE